MIVIDTPGLLSAPGKLRHLNEQQRALQQVRAGAEFQVVCLYLLTASPNMCVSMCLQAAKEAEALVLEKMKCPDYVILCVEVRIYRCEHE